jgi:hypothetical protein
MNELPTGEPPEIIKKMLLMDFNSGTVFSEPTPEQVREAMPELEAYDTDLAERLRKHYLDY